jgi:dihydropteroate synthase
VTPVALMGILNLTPDSFSDGGRFGKVEDAVREGIAMVASGADWVDIGGESTRPGAAPVSAEEEIARVLPVVSALAKEGIAVSVDTQKATVARATLDAGARMINDVSAMRDPVMPATVREFGVEIVLMHMQGTPSMMQQAPQYTDVTSEVRDYLVDRAKFAEASGIRREKIWIDPGIGFGKTVAHNLQLIRETDRLVTTGYPVLIGASRKAFIGKLTQDASVEDRLAGTLAVHLEAARKGAQMIRVHDVKAHQRAFALFQALQ